MRTQARRGKVMKLTMKRIYTGVSYLLGWFDRNILVTVLFFIFFVFAYWCAYLINKIKREIDTKNLNEMLVQFKEGDRDY